MCAWVIVLLIVSRPAIGQKCALYGKVVDEEGLPLPKAEILLERAADRVQETATNRYLVAPTMAQTDKDGEYEIPELERGAYAITVFMPGKEVVIKAITITGQSIRLDFQLSGLEKTLDEIDVVAENTGLFGMKRLRAVEVDALYEAKKNEVVVVDEIAANLATNNSRQIYAKIAGLNIWESDGAGVQLGIGGRGLSPNRNANFNTRQNGYDIAADAFGYPESYYTPPALALKEIEIVRGAASLQYGTQFGGLLNFVLKEGAEDRPLEFTALQTLGSFGLFNSFSSLGGTTPKLKYYGFYQYKHSGGWRPNEELTQHTAHASLRYNFSSRWSIKPEYTYMYYLAHQPGGLTDAQFEADPRQSNRERNWFSVHWNLWSVTSDYQFSGRTNANTRFFGLIAGRDALGNLGRIDRLDFGGNRDLLSDRFQNWGNETRLIHRYPLRSGLSVFLIGARYYSGFTDRKQGEANAEEGPDFEYLTPGDLQGSDFDLPNTNVSLFAENIFNVTDRLSIVPGVRFEYLKTEAEGQYRNTVRDLAGNILTDERIDERRERIRSFVFFGVGLSYAQSPALEVYSNFSQNYRAINFNDIRVSVGSLEVDPDIRDERGFNAELGARGSLANIVDYDASLFLLSYQDRIGTVLKREPNPQFNNLVDRLFRFRTNIADAQIYGVEHYAEVDLYKLFVNRTSATRLSLFTNMALISAEYSRSEESGIEGNKVELVPRVNFKTGLTFELDNIKVSYQFSYVSKQFSDASNALRTPTAIEGIIPAYHVMDVSARYTFKRFRIDAGVNNLSNTIYFTRRATGYPGPGILPSTGRSFYLTAGVRL